MIIFVTLVSLWIFGRISFLGAVVMAPDCLSIEPVLHGTDERIDGALDTLALAAVAALGVIAVTGVTGWLEKTVSWAGAALGLANSGMAGLLIAQWLISWSFFHPDSKVAPIVMPLGPQVRELSVQSATTDWNPFNGIPGWAPRGEGMFYNEEIGIYAREEVVRPCFSAAFLRQNKLNRHPSGLTARGEPIAAIPDFLLEHHHYAYIFYDREHRYLTSDIYQFHDRYLYLQKRDVERDSSGRRVDPAEVWNLVEASLAQPAPEVATERPYTLEEINSMVEATWDREAPLP
jgi:hypothetical protein